MDFDFIEFTHNKHIYTTIHKLGWNNVLHGAHLSVLLSKGNVT